jgi:hypothetical protein
MSRSDLLNPAIPASPQPIASPRGLLLDAR